MDYLGVFIILAAPMLNYASTIPARQKPTILQESKYQSQVIYVDNLCFADDDCKTIEHSVCLYSKYLDPFGTCGCPDGYKGLYRCEPTTTIPTTTTNSNSNGVIPRMLLLPLFAIMFVVVVGILTVMYVKCGRQNGRLLTRRARRTDTENGATTPTVNHQEDKLPTYEEAVREVPTVESSPPPYSATMLSAPYSTFAVSSYRTSDFLDPGPTDLTNISPASVAVEPSSTNVERRASVIGESTHLLRHNLLQHSYSSPTPTPLTDDVGHPPITNIDLANSPSIRRNSNPR